MKRTAAVLVVALVSAGSKLPENNRFAGSATWDDGKAEVSLYDTRGPKYGLERTYETRIIVVKDDVLADELVKSSSGPNPGRTFESLKLIVEHDIPTGTYTYHQSVVTHFDRAYMSPKALRMNSIESCGLASVRMRVDFSLLRVRGESYWEGESDVDTAVMNPGYFYDGLPLWLRSLDFDRSRTVRIKLLPSQLSNHVHPPAIDSAEVEIKSAGPDSARVTVRHAEGEDRFWIGPEPDRTLIRWEKADGTVLVLRKRLRIAYWEYTKPGDERRLE